MNLPNNIKLPFFAYGIFKPGQLCFNRIKDLVKNSSQCTISGSLKERDGIPLLIENDDSVVKGTLIYFYEGKENEGYKRINDIEPDEVYSWALVNCDDSIKANALMGKKIDKGSSDLEDIDDWDGRNDPLFKQGLEEIELILKENPNFGWDLKSLFRLQMGYTLLWTAIERYAGLKYHLGNKATQKVYRIADEDGFIKSLKNNVREVRFIYSTTDLKKYTLDPNDPQKSIRYYYQVRSNAIHRGKVVTKDFNTIQSSLNELLAIFKDMLGEAFKEIDTNKQINPLP